MKPLFIVFEGIDGSGKSTQCDLFHKYLIKEGVRALKLFEPTKGEKGRKIRELLGSENMPETETMLRLFIEDRREDVRDNVLPALKDGRVVVMDRYYFSNAAYQGEKTGPTAGEILQMNLNENFPAPDRVYFIDIPVETALKRIDLRNSGGNSEVFEQKDFLEKVRENFLTIEDKSFLRIDGSLNIEEIQKIIIDDYKTLNR